MSILGSCTHLTERDWDVAERVNSSHNTQPKRQCQLHDTEALLCGLERLPLQATKKDGAMCKHAASGHVQDCKADRGSQAAGSEEEAIGE